MRAGSGQPQSFSQSNNASNGGRVYAHQGNGNQIINNGPVPRRGLLADTKVLLITLILDVAFFLYGMESYTGTNNNADNWRAGIFLVMLVVTGRMTRRWFQRR